nr:hypothetical protein [Tanacetum cinerariifolium]
MINNSSSASASASLAVAAAALLISFVCPPEIVNVGLVFLDDVILNPLPFRTCVATTKELVIKEKIFLALATLGLNGQQSVLVQFWSPTKAGNTYLLYTCRSFGYYGPDKGLLVYRRGCLHHAFYIHHEENVSFGLPGRAFMEGTPQQTQDVHDYPVDQRPLCENAIFSMKWGSIAVPVILDAECVGVLEFVMTGPTGRYDELMNEVYKALEFSGFQSSLKLDTPRRTCIAKKYKSSIKHDVTKETESSKKKTRTTQSSIYARYNVLVALFGLSKAEAMKEIERRFHLKKKVIDSTFTNALRNKVGITEWPWIRHTHSRASSSASENQSNPTVSEAASSIGTPDSVLTLVCDAVISEELREQTVTPIASAFEAQLYETPLETSQVAEMSCKQTPTMEPSALGLPEQRLLAVVRELDEMEEDQDDMGVHDQGRFNDILISFKECFYDTSGDMEIDIATSVLQFE